MNLEFGYFCPTPQKAPTRELYLVPIVAKWETFLINVNFTHRYDKNLTLIVFMGKFNNHSSWE
jgi:hypothetical protein